MRTSNPKAPVKLERRAKDFVLTPADIERVELCPASRVFTGPRPEMHPGMWFGIFIHRFLEYCATQGRAQALAYIARKSKRLLPTCERLQIDVIPENGIPEMELALDLENGSCDAVDYDMARPESHIFMRTDLVFLDDAGIWNVWDYKTGNTGEKYEKIVAKKNVALMSAALGLARMHNVDEVRGSIMTIDSKAGTIIPDSRLYKRKTLEKHEVRLKLALYETLETRAEFRDEGIEPDIAPAPERCRSCRANLVCHGAALLK